ncbi:hypothetical protein RE476_07085 [Methanolobus mangrovi]|uniref:Uncharacterized protein n=1 Tax=Methanolobus mangrovi TaxID=3072977 RepID=A0AA51UDH3_9EURY|nr:hypothetical protein [Methanolobus mangrovi]WMW21177.1 hypothetical protein RE476_07085 [Methanolobus mangrovi]
MKRKSNDELNLSILRRGKRLVVITKYRAIAVFALLLLMILIALMPQEQMNIDFENQTNETQDNMSENSTLMSTTDDKQTDEEPGWWKHEGHSTVTGTNTTPGSYPNTDGDDSKNDTQEIPEFPSIAAPVIITLSIVLFAGKK